MAHSCQDRPMWSVSAPARTAGRGHHISGAGGLTSLVLGPLSSHWAPRVPGRTSCSLSPNPTLLLARISKVYQGGRGADRHVSGCTRSLCLDPPVPHLGTESGGESGGGEWGSSGSYSLGQGVPMFLVPARADRKPSDPWAPSGCPEQHGRVPAQTTQPPPPVQ